jgi:23S rRNA (guanosine2251-2'-O)-methyltransferase
MRVSAGAANHIPIACVTNINQTINYLKERGVFVMAAETGGKSVYESNLKGPLAIVVGGENNGVNSLTKKLCDEIISLPVLGKVNSLNASVACGAVLYEAVRQRKNDVK